MTQLPAAGEDGAYFAKYVQLVPEGDLGQIFADQMDETLALLSMVTEAQGDYRYAEGKWSLKEVVGHITDNERIMAFRLMWIARGLQSPLPGYDQDELMAGATFAAWSWSDVIEDYTAVRRATLTLLRGIPDEAWTRQGTVSGGPMSARAMAYILAGHERHHVQIIKERYLR